MNSDDHHVLDLEELVNVPMNPPPPPLIEGLSEDVALAKQEEAEQHKAKLEDDEHLRNERMSEEQKRAEEPKDDGDGKESGMMDKMKDMVSAHAARPPRNSQRAARRNSLSSALSPAVPRGRPGDGNGR